MTPLISVIIPCYNLGEYILECINSIQNQTYNKFEIIVVDDGSTDPFTETILKKIDDKKVIVYFQKNAGVSVARNVGASYAKGDYLLFLDADDKIDCDYLKLAVDHLELRQDLDYIYSDYLEFGLGNRYVTTGDLCLNNILLHATTHVSGIISRNLWLKSGGFDKDFINGWEDWDFLIRISSLNINYIKIQQAMLFYRIRENSRDKIANILYHTDLEQLVYKKNILIYFSTYSNPISILRSYEEQNKIMQDLNLNVQNIHKTVFYRLGDFLLKPLKYLVSQYLKSGKN